MKTDYGMVVYLFEPFYKLYKDKIITPALILSVLSDIKEQGTELEALHKVEFEQYQQRLGGGRVIFTFPEDLGEWYSDINLNKKRGLWVKLHYKLIDKIREIWYNVNNTML